MDVVCVYHFQLYRSLAPSTAAECRLFLCEIHKTRPYIYYKQRKRIMTNKSVRAKKYLLMIANDIFFLFYFMIVFNSKYLPKFNEKEQRSKAITQAEENNNTQGILRRHLMMNEKTTSVHLLILINNSITVLCFHRQRGSIPNETNAFEY